MLKKKKKQDELMKEIQKNIFEILQYVKHNV